MRNCKLKIQKFLGCERESHFGLYIRIIVVVIFIFIFFICIIAQAYNFQILQQDMLKGELDKVMNRTEKVLTRRGDIYDRTGRLLAISLEVPTVVFVGAPITADKHEIALNLSRALNIPFNDVYYRVNSASKFSNIKRHVTEDETFIVEKLKLPGVKIIKEKRRFYPKSEFLGQVLGFVNIDQVGLYGIEQAYDNYLMSRSFKINKMVDRQGRDIYMDEIPVDEDLNGNNLVLTIDEEIQYIAETELRESVFQNSAKGGIAIVIDPSSFEILAFAHVPGFDPNNFETLCNKDKFESANEEEIDVCKNRGIFDRFESGSTCKIFTVAAALTYTDLTLSSVINTHGGKCKIANFTIEDTHKMASATILDIVKYSSNCGAKEIALMVGIDNMYEMLRKFGFGSPTGIDLKNEASGVLWSKEKWSKTNLQTIGYGYGYSVTAMQMAVAIATIANGGVRMRPRLVKKIINASGEIIKEFEPEVMEWVIPEHVAKELILAMKTVLEKGGTAALAATDDYIAAGKTGTSKIKKTGVKAYSNKYIGSFMGVVPAEKPRLAIFIAIQEPTKAIYGGKVAGPVFKNIAERSLKYLGVLSENEELYHEDR